METSKKTVLLVEDEPLLLKTNSLILQKSGFAVLAAADGMQALELAERSCDPIDLLLTDLNLPVMAGDVLAETLSARYADLKVVFLTGSCCDCQLDRLDGQHQVLRKPVGLSDLLKTVSATLA